MTAAAGQVVTKAKYAALVGLSKGRVTQLTKPGELLEGALTKDNKIDVALANKLRGLGLDGAMANAKLFASEQSDDGDDLVNPLQSGLTAEKLRKVKIEVERSQLEFEKEKGRLVDQQALEQQLSEDLQLLFEALRTSGRPLAERLSFDELLPAEHLEAATRALNNELTKLVKAWRDGLKEDDDA